jgi:hypothetical protein
MSRNIFFFSFFFYSLKIDMTFKITIRLICDTSLLNFDLMIILKATSTFGG